VRAQLATVTSPPQSAEQLLDTLQWNGLVQTVKTLRPLL
jgi:hypothetical protein